MEVKRKDYLKKFTIVVVSIFLSLQIAEGISRIIFDPIDYLKPNVYPTIN